MFLADAATGIGQGQVFTKSDGTYVHQNLRPGIYKVQVRYRNRYQWVPQKIAYADGAVFTVTAGATTVVDETLLPGAVLNVLGPYAWPIHYTAMLYPKYYAWEWSGRAADRRSAEPVKVASGQSTTANAALRSGGTLTGRTLQKDGAVYTGYVDVRSYNARTGDVAGPVQYGSGGTYTLRGFTGQRVKIKFQADGPGFRWHEDAATFEQADPVRVRQGHERTLDITVSSPS
ncbi:carboxypeptidase-like regulatory domain-containing protein [Nonomuraea typhae]|uniref:carboxypeptidase-like regulatory domain-containing protein n=1 Tax=Nonomuraea typhae TaxID=2603600 RepID=UPI0012FC3143|nr:carboxypeptidase-like regulatory domain-containing protein [Nonomuraea typhae]